MKPVRRASAVWLKAACYAALACSGCGSGDTSNTGPPNVSTSPPSAAFDFKAVLFGVPQTLVTHVDAIDIGTGLVTLGGGDTRRPSIPFDFTWGDGSVSSGFFPQDHTYRDRSTNYVVTVVSHYADGTQGTAKTLARFTPPSISLEALPSTLLVTIPSSPVTLGTHHYPPPVGLGVFEDSCFQMLTRAQAEYVLSVAAMLQYGFANSDVFLVDNAFNQVILRDPEFGGMYSLWFTSPVAVGSAADAFSGTPQYSSFFHELGHNVSLNSPARHYFGGKIDGSANAIFSETMGEIFAHATAYALLNGESHGLSADLRFEIEQSALASMQLVRSSFDDYVSNAKPYTSWNDPTTPDDETFGTFMALAYKFFEQAENRGTGYSAPLKRMMALLQTFDGDLEARYDRRHDTEAASVFRSTLMIAAISYAFDTDLRAEFHALNFPVDDDTYTALLARPR